MAILEKIAKIRDGLVVEKTGYDERSDFKFFRASDVANGVRKAMAEHGVVHSTKIEKWTEDNFWDQNGRNRPRHTAMATVTFKDVDDGSEFPTQVIATGSDTGSDRGPRKLMTQIFKEAAIDVFIVTDEMEKFDSDGDKEAEPINNSAPASIKDEVMDYTEYVRAASNDPESGYTGAIIGAIGKRIAKENGVDERSSEWRKSDLVMRKLVEAMQNGEVE